MISFVVRFVFQEPIKSRAPQLHLEYRFYKQLGSSGKHLGSHLDRCVLYTQRLFKIPPPFPFRACMLCELRGWRAPMWCCLLYVSDKRLHRMERGKKKQARGYPSIYPSVLGVRQSLPHPESRSRILRFLSRERRNDCPYLFPKRRRSF